MGMWGVREVDKGTSIPNSQFPIPNSQFPMLNSQFPILNVYRKKTYEYWCAVRKVSPLS
ncbi:MAG: hypothetical protein F6K31_19605 [Symploca sp. SIO2G7]|nr:hypothetical protein [Symploca sp. SIO2G7]